MMKYNQGSKENQKKAIIPKNMFMEGQIHEQNKGITLIALVITIIVLLILAAVTINTLTGENGIITRASQAADATGEANAEEQVQLAVVASMETDGTIDLDNLNEELAKIDGLTYNDSAISDTNKIGSLPATVNVDGYDVKITGDGSVKQPGKWAKTTNSAGETVITDGTTELKIGDYVNYQPSSVTYTSPQGTYNSGSGEDGTMTQGNGYADQTFDTSTYTNGWRVLGLDEDTDEILLISEKIVQTTSTSNGYFWLRGQTGYQYGVEELNNICAIYGTGTGASGARSINVDDINSITGYDPSNTGDGSVYGAGTIYEYGNRVTYTHNGNNITYNEATTTSSYSVFRYFSGNTWKSLASGESATLTSTQYQYYPTTLTENSSGEVKGIEENSTEYEMLFAETSSGQRYCLTSPYTRAYSGYAYFGLIGVLNGKVQCGALFYSYGLTNLQYYGVRPVVSLESDINISGGSGTSDSPYQIQ